jgi:uncharacterized protein (TIGR02145 family)
MMPIATAFRMLAFLVLAFMLHLSAAAQLPCSLPARLDLKVLLEGPMDSVAGLMNDALRQQGLVPLNEPYTALGYAYRGGGGGESIDPSVLLNTGEDAIVDWVIVEVRAAGDPGRLIFSRAGLLQRDGDVADVDGVQDIGLCVEPGNYHIAVRHRNHLGIMTADPVSFFTGQFGFIFADPVDLSSPDIPVYRNAQARRKMGVFRALWSGDVTFDGRVQYVGDGNDRDVVLQAIGGVVPTNTVNGYEASDVNLNGITRYTGEGNDRDPILNAIGGVVPTRIREGYIPKDSLSLRPNVHIVDPLAWVLDTNLSDLNSGNVLVFDVNTDMEDIDTGHVVVGGEYGGYLRKVLHVDSTGTTLTLITTQGDLYDIFASGSLVISTPVNTSTPSFASAHPQSIAGGLDIVFPGGGCVQGGLKDLDVTLNGSLRQEGEFTSTPLGDNCSWSFTGSIHMNGKVELGIGFCAAPIDIELDLIPPIPFQAGIPVPVAPGVIVIVPVAGTFAVQGIAGLEVMSGSTFNSSNQFNLDIQGRVGVDFEAGIPRPISEMSLVSPSFQQEDQIYPSNSSECELTGGIKLGVQLYNLAGPYLSFVGSHSIAFTVSQTTSDKDFEYKNNYKLIPGFEAEIWKKFDANFEVESPSVVEYLWPGKLELVSDPLPVGPEEEELDDPIQVRVSGKLEILGQDIPMPAAANVPVSFEVLGGGGSITEEGEPVLTDAFGIAEAHWTLGSVTDGEQLAQARVLKGSLEDIEEQSPLALHAEIESYKMVLVSGDGQIGSVNSELQNPLVVRVINQLDEPVAAFPVHFEVAAGMGSISDDFVSTSSEGLASTMFTLGFDAASQNKVKAYALTLTGDTIEDAPQYFKAYIDPDTMFYAQLSGNYQTGPANSVLPVDLRVQINSVLGQVPQEDVLVFFEVVSGGGSVSSFATSTNSDGIASVAWTLGPDLTIRQKVKAWALDVYGDTLRGGPLEFEACTIICPPTVMDVDGNVYPVVKIGCDCWFQQNLRTHRFANGDFIQHVPMDALLEVDPVLVNYYSDLVWSTPSRSEDSDPSYSHDGLVYNSSALLDVRNVCPNGWHIPSNRDMGRIAGSLGLTPFHPNDYGSLEGYLFRQWPGEQGTPNITGFSQSPGRYIHGAIPLSATTATFNWEPWFVDGSVLHTGLWIGENGEDPWAVVFHTYLNSWIGEGPQQSDGIFSYIRCVMD